MYWKNRNKIALLSNHGLNVDKMEKNKQFQITTFLNSLCTWGTK